MAFSYIELQPNYILLQTQPSVSLTTDISAIQGVVFGKLFQVSSGSSLTIGTDYCLDGDNIRALQIEGINYYLALESNIRFTETPPPSL